MEDWELPHPEIARLARVTRKTPASTRILRERPPKNPTNSSPARASFERVSLDAGGMGGVRAMPVPLDTKLCLAPCPCVKGFEPEQAEDAVEIANVVVTAAVPVTAAFEIE